MKILINILLILWQLPQNILGGILYLFTKARFHSKHGNISIYTSQYMRGGISLGNFIIINQAIVNNLVIRHELGHCKQSKILGFLYLVVIGLPSLIHATFHTKGNYYDFYTERWADKLMGIKR